MTKTTIERRIVDAEFQVRTNEDGTTGARGYAAVFESPAHGEVIKRSAFNRTIAQKDNVRFLVNHEGTPLASTRAGTMTVGVDDRGLWFDIPAFDLSNPRAQEFVSATARGDLHQCSFAGYWRDAPVISGTREVREVELIDVSGVTFPWYDDTEVSITGDRNIDRQLLNVRSADDAPIEFTAEQRATADRTMQRTAPPGKTSWGDTERSIWDAIEMDLQAYVYVCDIGSDWVVYRAIDMATYEYGPTIMRSWKQNADGSFKLGVPVEVKTEYNPVTAERSHTLAEARAILARLVPPAA